MNQTTTTAPEHGVTDGAPSVPQPLAPTDPAPRLTPAEEARTSVHADALLAIAHALAGYPDAAAARCTGLDRRGIDLAVQTPRGRAPARVGFPEPLDHSSQLRAATVELTRRARAIPGRA
ncbi:MAG TPA: DUF2470 domain-containing protein [Solirubrobacteraceae bacterium]